MSNLRAFTMPKWGIEMTTGSISEWMVEEGAAFAKGDVLLAIETDKIVNEVEADYDAVCLRKVASVNSDYAVGALLAVFGDAGTSAADIDAFVAEFQPADGYSEDQQEEDPAPQATNTAAAAETPASKTNTQSAPARKIDASPVKKSLPEFVIPDSIDLSKAARELVQKKRLDVTQLSGSGQKGRILLQDVEQLKQRAKPYMGSGSAVDIGVAHENQSSDIATPIALRLATDHAISLQEISGSGKHGRVRLRDLQISNKPRLGSGEVVSTPFSRMRGHIAERLTKSHREIPHYYLQTQANVDELMHQRDQYNQSAEHHATINDVIILATARALRAHPDINIHVVDNAVKTFGDVNVAIAVAIEDGLITPVVQQADRRSLSDLSREARRLINGARAGKLSLPDYGKGTFTVSNLGMHGINEFTSIINPPQAAILSVGMFQRVPREEPEGIAFGWQVSLTMACDHRAIDGTTGTKMLATLKNLLESPKNLFR